jgi:purine-nucleoside phosphorylase
MSTPHNRASLGEIAKTVIMPGDPLRAKYIVENFLDDYKLVSDVRGIYAYTGTYKGTSISVMASGMGMPSMGIYCYELYKFYNVENIIRIGSCGAYKPELKLFDIILSEGAYSEGNFALTLNNDNCHYAKSNNKLNNAISSTADRLGINLVKGNTVCTDCFDVYMTDVNQFLDRLPKDLNPISAEMEAFALFYTAKMLNKKASCLMSVVDSKYIDKIATTEERESGLNNMIKVALESSITL